MMNNKLIIAIMAILLVIGLVAGGVLIITNKDNQSENQDNIDSTMSPDIDVPNDTIKVEDETIPGVSPTPFVDIAEGNEIYFDADVVEKLSLLHEKGDEDHVNGMLPRLGDFINGHNAGLPTRSENNYGDDKNTVCNLESKHVYSVVQCQWRIECSVKSN